MKQLKKTQDINRTKFINYFVFILICFHVFSCNKKSSVSDDDKSIKIEEKKQKNKKNNIVDSTEIKNAYSTKKILVLDFNKNGSNDTLIVSTSALSNKNDEIIWDDSQHWRVHLQSEHKLKTIYENEIQLGKLNVYYNTSENTFFLVEDAPYQKSIYKIDTDNNWKLIKVNNLPDFTKYKIVTLE
ncbi:hypothetical protein [uncultured Polaribacter sp.]|uniref:hypothetical protein n=1 Tax=uncultured Polaribacter sp. TaxID=174711 RepID=UPI00261E5806|nr:hypothetical protein [uncultured Polaribacter sp.]